MSYIAAALPGFQFSLGLFLLFFASVQLYIFRTKGFKRARWVGLFCLTAAVISFCQFTVQSRIFPEYFGHLFLVYILFHTGMSRYFYIKSLSYFVAIPDRYLNIYLYSNTIIWIFGSLPVLSFLVDGPDLMFDRTNKVSSGNYFLDSYSAQIGEPVVYGMAILSAFAFFDLIMAIYLFIKIRNSTGDKWFMVGMFATSFAALSECFLLPLTQAYYVPTYFLSNFFEASRMSFLSTREYLIAINSQRLQGDEEFEVPVVENSPINDEMISDLSSKLKVLLDDKHIYKKPKLNLDELSRELKVPSYVVSQVLNYGLKTNFFELLNQYRIAAVKKDLENPALSDRTIIDIAFTQGFNSKSSFNSSFKRLTGETPSAYRKKYMKN